MMVSSGSFVTSPTHVVWTSSLSGSGRRRTDNSHGKDPRGRLTENRLVKFRRLTPFTPSKTREKSRHPQDQCH